MTIPALATQPSITFTVVENGVYDLPFDVFDDSDNLQAWYRDSEDSPQDLKFGTDLIINFDSGFGTIFLVKDLAVGSKFTVVRTIQNDQTKTFKSTQLFSTQIENALDKLTTIAQDNDFEKTCIRTASDEDAKLELPINQNRVFTALTINKEGDVETKSLRNIGVKVPATRSDLGFVKIGDKLSIEDTGLVNVPSADNSTFGVVKVGEGINLNDGTISVDKSEILQLSAEAEENSANANTLIQNVPSNISFVNDTATTAQTRVNEQVVNLTASPPGKIWISAKVPPLIGRCYAVTTIGSRLVTVGAGMASYSDDQGDHWTSATTHPTGDFRGITVLGTRLITVGYRGEVSYSDDQGDHWTPATTLPMGGCSAVTTIGTRVVSVGGGIASYSDDQGDHWTSVIIEPLKEYKAVTTIGSRLVTVGNDICLFSDDQGVNWSQAATSPSGNCNAIITVGSRLITVGTTFYGGGMASYSDDQGNHWTSATTPPCRSRAVTLIGSRLVSIGYNEASYSDDNGDNWTSVRIHSNNDDFYGITTIGTRVVSVGNSEALYSVNIVAENLTVPQAINRVLEMRGV